MLRLARCAPLPRGVLRQQVAPPCSLHLRRLRAGRAAASLDEFDAWLADNPPPAALLDHGAPAWSGARLAAQQDMGPSAATYSSPAAAGTGKRFHWRDTHVQTARLARCHEVHWCPERGGYLCTPKHAPIAAADAAVAAAGAGASSSEVAPQQAGCSTADGTAATAPLLLTLPPILWTRRAEQLPLGHFHALAASSGAAPDAQLITLLSADSAALAVCRGGEIVRHKVLTGYTVRKNRNGKAQLTYKRSNPGKSSVGGGIRAAEARRLFASVAERLNEWRSDVEACDGLLVFSGGVRVWNEVFAALGSDSFLQRRDPRWYRLPRSVAQPRFKDVERAVNLISYGTFAPLDIET